MRALLFAMLLFSGLFAKTQLASPIAPAFEEFINLNTTTCDSACLAGLVSSDELASFVVAYEQSLKNQSPKTKGVGISDVAMARLFYQARWGQEGVLGEIAVILPRTLGPYAKAVAQAITAYIASQDAPFRARFLACQSEADIGAAMAEARSYGASVFIVPMRQSGLLPLFQNLRQNEIAYIPSLAKNELKEPLKPSGRVVFGGVDYAAQVALLAQKSSGRVVLFNDNSELSSRLAGLLGAYGVKIFQKVSLLDKRMSPEFFAKSADSLSGADIFLSLPLTKSAFAVNYLPKFEISPRTLLASQIAFNPQLFSLLGRESRLKLFVASSILPPNDRLSLAGELLGDSLWYNWVAYSAGLGFERLGAGYFGAFGLAMFSEKMDESQMRYETKIYKAQGLEFIPQ